MQAEVEVDEEVHVKLAAALTAAVVVARHRRALGVADSVAEPLGRALRGAEVRVVDAVAAVVLALRDVARAVAGAVADPARQAARRALAKLRLRLLDRAAAGVPAECGMWGVRCGVWGVTQSWCGPYRKPNSHEHVASVCVHETSSGESACTATPRVRESRRIAPELRRSRAGAAPELRPELRGSAWNCASPTAHT